MTDSSKCRSTNYPAQVGLEPLGWVQPESWMGLGAIEDINNRQDLRTALAAHDWWYRESDDYTIYEVGSRDEQSFEWVLKQFECPFDMLTFHKFFSPGHMEKLTSEQKQAIENWFNE